MGNGSSHGKIIAPPNQGYNPADFSYATGPPQPQPQQHLAYPGGPPPYTSYPGVDPEVQQWFDAVDVDRSGKISAKELQGALVNGQGKNFNITVCEMMVGMFTKDQSGTITVQEFQQLYKYINQWLDTFRSFDRDQSGLIEEAELSQAFTNMGYRFSREFVQFIITRSDKAERRRISVDQFILICIQIQKFTDAFRARDTEMKGVISISFEEFLSVALSASA